MRKRKNINMLEKPKTSSIKLDECPQIKHHDMPTPRVGPLTSQLFLPLSQIVTVFQAQRGRDGRSGETTSTMEHNTRSRSLGFGKSFYLFQLNPLPYLCNFLLFEDILSLQSYLSLTYKVIYRPSFYRNKINI